VNHEAHEGLMVFSGSPVAAKPDNLPANRNHSSNPVIGHQIPQYTRPVFMPFMLFMVNTSTTTPSARVAVFQAGNNSSRDLTPNT